MTGRRSLILESQIENKTLSNNTLKVTLRDYVEGDVNKESPYYEIYTLVYENERWVVDDCNNTDWNDFNYRKNH